MAAPLRSAGDQGLSTATESAIQRVRLLEIGPADAFCGERRTGTAGSDAVEIDSLLFSLCRGEAHRRHVVGRLAARFLRRKGHHRLGFARLDDYSRERLGIGGRELQSFASVATRLSDLPMIAATFARGEISWSHTRLLCGVARSDSEEEWLERTRGRTVRAVVADIRTATAVDRALLETAADEESGTIEGEESARFRIRCPARILSLWRRTVELARRMLGSEAPAWKAADAIAAEASSAIPFEASEEPSDGVAVTAQATAGVPPSPPEAEWVSNAFPGVDWTLEVAAGEDSLAEIDSSLDGLDAFALDERLREVIRAIQQTDACTGRLLARALDDRLHRRLGFPSFDRYVQERLAMSPARARALVRIERSSRNAPLLAAAYREGELSWVRALAILPVLCGGHESDWVARAREITVRRLNDEVEWALEVARSAATATTGGGFMLSGITPPPADARLDLPDLQTCAGTEGEVVDREVTFSGPASVVGLFRAAVLSFRQPGEPPWKGLERLLLHVFQEWTAQPRHRDPIFERDGWRCTVPACTSRRDLHDHHREYRSRGGGNERWNRTTVCWLHHRDIHSGLVRAHGRAPDSLVWELGLRPGHQALLVLRGDRYLSGL